MGGGRGLLGRETLGPGGGCSGEGPRAGRHRPDRHRRPRAAPPPPLRSSRLDLPRSPVPSRACLPLFQELRSRFPLLPLGLALERAAAVCGQRGPSRAHLDSVLDSSCELGSGYALDRPPQPSRRHPLPARLPGRPASMCPATCAAVAITIRRIAPTDRSLQRRGLTREVSELATAPGQ